MTHIMENQSLTKKDTLQPSAPGYLDVIVKREVSEEGMDSKQAVLMEIKKEIMDRKIQQDVEQDDNFDLGMII